MLTVEKLAAAGADTADGITRCANNEAFYLKIAEKVIRSEQFDLLKERLDEGDLKGAFESAHALKGLVGNASLRPLETPIKEITEHLRHEEQMDYAPLMEEITSELEIFRGLLED